MIKFLVGVLVGVVGGFWGPVLWVKMGWLPATLIIVVLALVLVIGALLHAIGETFSR